MSSRKTSSNTDTMHRLAHSPVKIRQYAPRHSRSPPYLEQRNVRRTLHQPCESQQGSYYPSRCVGCSPKQSLTKLRKLDARVRKRCSRSCIFDRERASSIVCVELSSCVFFDRVSRTVFARLLRSCASSCVFASSIDCALSSCHGRTGAWLTAN